MRKKVLILSAGLVFLASCVIHRVDVALRPDFGKQIQAGSELANVTPAMIFFKGEYLDKRPDPTKLTTFKQMVGSVDFYEKRPMLDALYEGVKALVTASKHTWRDSAEGDVKVNLTFINLQATPNTGFATVGTMTSIQVQADFLNAKTGALIYSCVYTGQDDREEWGRAPMSMYTDSIDASIIRCIQSIGDDARLAKALVKIRS